MLPLRYSLIKNIFITLFCGFSASLYAQYGDIEITGTPYAIDASIPLEVDRTTTEIHLDGELNEATWGNAKLIGDFWEKFPTDQVKASLPTYVKAAFDDRNIYFAIIAFDSTDTYVAETLKRDQSIRKADGIAVILDPVNRKSNGFGFAVTPYNVQSEYQFGAFTDGQGLSTAWDNKWYSAVKRYKDKYIIEIAIPFKTLRYDINNKTWGINIIRSDQKKNKFYTWHHVPVQFPGFDLGYLGKLKFNGDLPNAKGNASIIPYINSSVTGDKENNLNTHGKLNAGFDAKLSVTPSLNLDMTVNPDFSQVDVDQQVTNLTRFNIFFPEKRTFFLENDDIFSDYGPPPFRPFFSRKIGLDANGNSIPILFGARLSGNLNEKLRIGAFNIQTARKDTSAAQNYTALSMHRRLFKRSVIKAYFLNHTANLNDAEKTKQPLDKFGRNAGTSFVYSDESGKWNAWSGIHYSFKPGIHDHNEFYEAGGGYFGRKFNTFIDFDHINNQYYADMGFINRLETTASKAPDYDHGDTTLRIGFNQFFNQNSFYLFPSKGKIIRHTITIENAINFNINRTFSDRSNSLKYIMMMKNTSMFLASFSDDEDHLKYYFGLPDLKPLRPVTYHNDYYDLEYDSDTRKNFLFIAGLRRGKYYGGNINQYRASVIIRKQPYVQLALQAEYDRIKFPTEYGTTQFWLISPKTEVNFSNNLFWTTFFQYNTQRNNFNINSRVQWRFKPMSDVYLVYTDNYFADTLHNRNRALVLKVNYWLTV